MKTTKTSKIYLTIAASLCLLPVVVCADERGFPEWPQQPGAAQGTEVGNGGASARDLYLRKVREKMRIRLQPGNPLDVNSQNQLINEMRGWCANVGKIIRTAVSKAKWVINSNQNYPLAEEIIETAMLAAAQSPNVEGPIMKDLIDRGLLLSEAMDEAFPNPNFEEQVSKVYFLLAFADFIERQEASFDRDWYIPYRFQYYRNQCRGHESGAEWMRGFQKAFIQFAYDQLYFIFRPGSGFVDVVREVRLQNGDIAPDARPVGNPFVFLKAVELISAYVASDLRNNLFAAVNLENISRLEEISENLSAYLDGNWFQTKYNGTPLQVVPQVFDDILVVAHNLRWLECRSYPACIGFPREPHRCWNH